MGRPKALIPFPDIALIEVLAQRFSPVTDDLIVISNLTTQLDFLKIPVFPDLVQDAGPLAGLYTGLFYARYEMVAMIACDLPFADQALISAQQALMTSRRCDVVIPVVDGQAESLHALYRRNTCLPVVKAALEAGLRRLVDWHDAVQVYEMNDSEIKQSGADRRAFFNINTPADLEQALALLAQTKNDA